jgi:hypothetical protein
MKLSPYNAARCYYLGKEFSKGNPSFAKGNAMSYNRD